MPPSIPSLLQDAAAALGDKNFLEAQRCSHAVLQIDRENPAATEVLAVVALNTGNAYLAAELFEKLVRRGFAAPDLFNNLGEAFRLLGDNPGAERHYKKALALKKDHVPALNNLGTVQLAMGQIGAAQASFRKVLRAVPAHLDATNNLGNVFLAKKAFEEARKCYQRCLALSPAFVPAMNNLGVVEMQLGNLEAARHHFSKALQIDPKFADALKNLQTLRDASPALRINR
ncbi:MAG: tetratricopeptide repeat protein [Telmatospirillum sp.]|nr:tetratricopeptide repeat protein [Telmatospirillum sp.]